MAPVPPQFGVNRTNLLTRILTLPSPFPSLTSIFIANVPVIVFFLAALGYLIDYIASRFSGGLRSNEVEIFDFIVSKFIAHIGLLLNQPNLELTF